MFEDVVSQHLGFESNMISDPNSKYLDLSGFVSGEYWPGHFWSWLDLLDLGNSYSLFTNSFTPKFGYDASDIHPKEWGRCYPNPSPFK